MWFFKANSDEGWKNAKSIYEFSALDIDGNKVDFNKYRYDVTTIWISDSRPIIRPVADTKAASALYDLSFKIQRYFCILLSLKTKSNKLLHFNGLKRNIIMR